MATKHVEPQVVAVSPAVYDEDDNGEPVVIQAEEGTEFSSIDDIEPAAPVVKDKTVAAVAVVEDELPAHLKGKTAAQLAKMYEESQRMVGRHAREVGELRNLADTHIRARLAEQSARATAGATPATPAVKPEDEDVVFFANPKAAVAKAIAEGVANHPEVKKLREQNEGFVRNATSTRMAHNQKAFEVAHPDSQAILASPEFQEWVGASKVRVALLKAAHERYDVDAAMEVFGTWKQLRSVGQKSAEQLASEKAAAADAKKKALRAAVVPAGGGGAPAPGGGSGKIYRRADIINLMENDNARYQQLAPEIELAYAEGRVR